MGLKNTYYQNKLNLAKLNKRSPLHSFHRYFGKFIPAIPEFAIKEFTKPGDTILDAFCGSGTSLVEAKLNGRNSIGIDINPLAIQASRVKTTPIDIVKLDKHFNNLINSVNNDKEDYSVADEPYCVNINHWFRPEVKSDLLKIRHHILLIDDEKVKDFFLTVFSAFMRNVSNADPQHVFPGYSKRLRLLDLNGKRKINVLSSFESAAKKRTKYISLIPKNKSTTKLYNLSSTSLPKGIKNIALAIINPPYISSIRYLETMKIEMGWLGYFSNQQDYLNLDKKVLGTERYYKVDLQHIDKNTGICDLDERLAVLENENPKMAKVVSEYFIGMRKSLKEIVRVLIDGGYLVIKISDSTVRNFNVPTSQYFIDILEQENMKIIARFKDDFDPNSRSLLTARNSYSGIMTYDWILIFEKK